MRHDPTFAALVPLLAVVAVVLVGAAGDAAALPAEGSSVESVTGTIRSVDADTSSLEIVTGVGHALRLLSMAVDPACDIEVEGARSSLRGLKAGQVVRIRYQKADGRKVARTIVTPPQSDGGGVR